MPNCFLCQPDERLIYLREARLFAMLGHGPLGRGYSLIATADHVPSMLDLDDEAAQELVLFTERVRATLRPVFGEAVITEHGRVAACVAAVAQQYEPHCLHAHRLVFPGEYLPDLRTELPGYEVIAFRSFTEARRNFRWPGQYLYVESPDASCHITAAPQRVPRQFFRRVIAARRGEPEFTDWQRAPRLDEVEAAARDLGLR
jgi:diadenosine tetraphosphate (Ap4A) HIT family hydrolase